MSDDVDQFDSALRGLINKARDPMSELERASVQAIQYKLMVRACAGLLNEVEYERRRFVDHVSAALPAPSTEPLPRVLTQVHPVQPQAGPPAPPVVVPNLQPQRKPWSQEDFADLARRVASSARN